MWCLLLILAPLILLTFNYQRLLGHLKRLRKDITTLKLYFLMVFNGLTKYRRSVCANFDRIVADHPHKVLFYFEDEIWTRSEQNLHLFCGKGYGKGDAIGLLVDNCPEYICMWLGLAQIGVVTALINTHIVRDALVHSIKVSNCKAIIFGSNYESVVEEITPRFNNLEVYQLSTKTNRAGLDLRSELKKIDPYSFRQKLNLNGRDVLMYIFTSGTTGLPKAAYLSHTRYNLMTTGALLTPSNSVLYCPLPLYHSSGTVLGVGQAIVWGKTVVLRKKFSASAYWSDCIKYRCNMAQYIGEMCRYVLAASGVKSNHPVKFMFGNGLKPQISKQFVSKFGIERVYEFYGSTEGNCALINLTNTVGSVGCIPLLLKWVSPLATVKFDEDTGEPLRDEDGRCIKTVAKEPGVLIVKIISKFFFADFKGYTNRQDTNKKVLRDVFKPGDRYFNTGDVMEEDEEGNFYFVDRTGDTFRWKGENVSTCEVEGIINNLIGLSDASVFGVQIPGTEGRAGMVAIASDSLDLDDFLKGLKQNLPSHAIPLLVRILKALPLTSTCKLQKVQLRNEGYDVNVVKDVFFYDRRVERYVPLSLELYDEIQQNKLKL